MINKNFISTEKIGESDSRLTEIHAVKNGDFPLGTIKWYAPWRRYCFFPYQNMLFDRGCLAEIAKIIDGLMQQRRMLRSSKQKT